MAKKKFYAVARGGEPGIYEKWQGTDGAEVQVSGFPNALYKGFSALEDAHAWLREVGDSDIVDRNLKPETRNSNQKNKSEPKTGSSGYQTPESEGNEKKAKRVIIYTDGGCLGNPGPGGYGVVLMYGAHRKELWGGFRRTTNNRMELMACIVGLKALNRKCSVTIHSDSKYVINGITKGWAKRWRANQWMRNKTDAAENPDLWAMLLDLCDIHEVRFEWVKGHSGHPENERCDHLATRSASQADLPCDEGYGRG